MTCRFSTSYLQAVYAALSIYRMNSVLATASFQVGGRGFESGLPLTQLNAPSQRVAARCRQLCRLNAGSLAIITAVSSDGRSRHHLPQLEMAGARRERSVRRHRQGCRPAVLKVVLGRSIAFAGDHGNPSRIRCEGAFGETVHRRPSPADGYADLCRHLCHFEATSRTGELGKPAGGSHGTPWIRRWPEWCGRRDGSWPSTKR